MEHAACKCLSHPYSFSPDVPDTNPLQLERKSFSQNGNIRDFIMLVYIIPDNAKCIGNGAQSEK